MWSKMDYVVWTWLNALTTLVIVVLAIEQFTLLVASPFAVLGYAIIGWLVLTYLIEFSNVERKDCIGETAFMCSFGLGLFIQIILVYQLGWNQWLLTGNMIWLYAPLWPVVYWLSQIVYWIAMNFRCEVKE